MTTEMQLTARQNWQHHADEVQRHVNTALEELTAEIDATNHVLFEYEDPADVEEFAVEMLDEYNSRWPYHEDVFLVTGRWHKPVESIRPDGIISVHEQAYAFDKAISVGFSLKWLNDPSDDEEMVPRIGYCFKMGSFNLLTPTMRAEGVDLLAFAEIGEVSLQYLRPNNDNLVSAEEEEVAETFLRLDRILDLCLSHPDSTFYKLSGRRQQRFLEAMIDEATEVLPDPGTADRLILDNAKTPVILSKDPSQAGRSGVIELMRPNRKNFRITGDIIGITLADVLGDGYGHRYRSPADLQTAHQGIGFVVEPTEVNFDMSELPSSTLIVPSRAVKNLSLVVA